MSDLITVILLVGGLAFLLLASLGVVRMPDIFARMHATTKAATLGVILTLAAVAVHFADTSVTARALATILFLLLTAPVIAHMIGRAALFIGTPLWKGTIINEFKGPGKPPDEAEKAEP
ncbi:MAG: monovalent cation/H(+) antiporter subunit G [Chloroflexi bacterium]|nr:monovalent cation/H(+) antiporter subunit G [Chloroflexota bacterium]